MDQRLVEFPVEGLDISHTLAGPQEPLVYDLVAVINRVGPASGGHYTALCRSSTDKKWYRYDDDAPYVVGLPRRAVCGRTGAHMCCGDIAYLRRP